MVNTICVIIIYCLELLNLRAFAAYIYGIRFKHGRIKILILIASVFAVLLTHIVTEKFLFRQFTFFTFIIAYVFTSLMSESKKQLLKLMSAAFILKIASMLLWLCGVSVNLIRYDNFKYPPAFMIINLMLTFGVFLAVLWTKKCKNSFLLADYTRSELLYFISGEIALTLILAVITEFSSHYSAIASVGIPIIILSSGIMIFICYNLLSLKYQNRYIKVEQDTALNMISVQERYYKMLLKKEEQTKAFRHDIRNHLYCMRVLCDNSDYTQLHDYIDNLIEAKADMNTSVNSGDKLVDAVLNDLTSRYPSVKLRIFGAFSEKNTIDQIDICTIFSNLLTNAFEAAEKSDDKIVRLHIKRLNSNLLISIQNSVNEVPAIENNDIKTSKSGSNHGYGLKNARTSLAKYNGILELKCDEDIFEANVIIPDVLEISDR